MPHGWNGGKSANQGRDGKVRLRDGTEGARRLPGSGAMCSPRWLDATLEFRELSELGGFSLGWVLRDGTEVDTRLQAEMEGALWFPRLFGTEGVERLKAGMEGDRGLREGDKLLLGKVGAQLLQAQ